MEAKATRSIYFVNAGAGTAGIVQTEKETIGEFLNSQLGKHDPEKFLIRLNGQCPKSPQDQINDSDTISVTLTKIEGHTKDEERKAKGERDGSG